MVMLDKKEYINKSQAILVQRGTYRPLTAHPGSKYKKKLINMLRTVRAEEGLGKITFKSYLKHCRLPKIL